MIAVAQNSSRIGRRQLNAHLVVVPHLHLSGFCRAVIDHDRDLGSFHIGGEALEHLGAAVELLQYLLGGQGSRLRRPATRRNSQDCRRKQYHRHPYS